MTFGVTHTSPDVQIDFPDLFMSVLEENMLRSLMQYPAALFKKVETAQINVNNSSSLGISEIALKIVHARNKNTEKLDFRRIAHTLHKKIVIYSTKSGSSFSAI